MDLKRNEFFLSIRFRMMVLWSVLGTALFWSIMDSFFSNPGLGDFVDSQLGTLLEIFAFFYLCKKIRSHTEKLQKKRTFSEKLHKINKLSIFGTFIGIKAMIRFLWLIPCLFFFSLATSILWVNLIIHFNKGLSTVLFLSTPTSVQQGTGGDLIYQSLLLMMGILITPFLEEIVFRFAVFGRLCIRMRPALAALCSSLLFGLLHFDGISAFVYGFIMIIVYRMTKDLRVVILLHILHNLLSLLPSMILSHWTNQVQKTTFADWQNLLLPGTIMLTLTLPPILLFTFKHIDCLRQSK